MNNHIKSNQIADLAKEFADTLDNIDIDPITALIKFRDFRLAFMKENEGKLDSDYIAKSYKTIFSTFSDDVDMEKLAKIQNISNQIRSLIGQDINPIIGDLKKRTLSQSSVNIIETDLGSTAISLNYFVDAILDKSDKSEEQIRMSFQAKLEEKQCEPKPETIPSFAKYLYKMHEEEINKIHKDEEILHAKYSDLNRLLADYRVSQSKKKSSIVDSDLIEKIIALSNEVWTDDYFPQYYSMMRDEQRMNLINNYEFFLRTSNTSNQTFQKSDLFKYELLRSEAIHLIGRYKKEGGIKDEVLNKARNVLNNPVGLKTIRDQLAAIKNGHSWEYSAKQKVKQRIKHIYSLFTNKSNDNVEDKLRDMIKRADNMIAASENKSAKMIKQ